MASLRPPVRMGSCESFGWLRLPTPKGSAVIAYERPDGKIVHVPRYDSVCVVRVGNDPPYIKLMRRA